MSYGRQAIEERLEPAVRILIDSIDSGSVLRDDPDELWAHVQAVHDVIDELDAHDNEHDRKALISKAWKEIERALLRAHPITMVAPADEASRCRVADTPTRAGCSFRGKWTFDGLAAPGCKVHVTKRRDRGIAEIRDAAWKEFEPGKLDRWTQPRPPTIEIVWQVADKLGVRADVEERIAR
jgi:hypothetical protein